MNIRELREAAGITQGELAAEIGVKRSAVSMWEIGKSRPRTEDLPKIAEALGKSEKSVANAVFRIRSKLRALLEK